MRAKATFLVLARKAKTGRWQSSIANWLYTTARRIASETNRAAVRRVKREAVSAPRAPSSALDEMNGREAFAALDEELDKLPAIYREPLVLCYLEGLTRDEAASRLGIPSATLKSQLDRGRKKLADALTKRGIDIGAGLIAVAAPLSAEASSPRLCESILATVAGSPSVSVSAIAQGSAMKWFSLKAKLLILAAVTVAGTGFGLASMRIAAGPQRPAILRTKRRATTSGRLSHKPRSQTIRQSLSQSIRKRLPRTSISGLSTVGFMFPKPSRLCQESKRVQQPACLDSNYHQCSGMARFPNSRRSEVPFGLFVANVSDFYWSEGAKEPQKPQVALRFVASVTDQGLKELEDLKNLTALDLGHTQVTDAGLKELKDLTLLNLLSLEATNVTDAGMKNLKGFRNLTTLCLYDTQVTDAGLKDLKNLKNLTQYFS